MNERLPRTACFLLICVTPGVCQADVGDLGGIVDFAIMAIKYLTGWTLISLAFFFLLSCCKVRRIKRVLFTFLFWISPLFLLDPAVELYGKPGTHVIVHTKKPVVLAGATFPVGGQADYIHLGRGFWRRRLTGVTSVQPIKFGSLSITGLALNDLDANLADIDLAHTQSIEGWSCEGRVRMVVTSGAPRLSECLTATPSVIGDLVWPAETGVDRNVDGSWSVSSIVSESRDAADPYKGTFGLPVDYVNATYDASYQLQTWQGRVMG